MKDKYQKLKDEFKKLSKDQRLYSLERPIIGLTGNIACGKSTVAKLIGNRGLSVIDADQLIHKIYEREDTLNLLQETCPQALKNEVINFTFLRKEFFENDELKKKLSDHLYSKLPETFMGQVNKEDLSIVYDVPLLFEKGMQEKFDFIITVSSSHEEQLNRLKVRDPSSTIETLENIISQQLPIDQKEKLSDFVITNNGSLKELEGQVDLALEKFFT